MSIEIVHLVCNSSALVDLSSFSFPVTFGITVSPGTESESWLLPHRDPI